MRRMLRLAFALTTSTFFLACGSTNSGTNGTPASTGGTITGSLDGVWDITAAGGSAIGPSEMTVKAGSVTGLVIQGEEGTTWGACTTTKHRTEFTFNVEGNALSATLTETKEWSTPSCGTPIKRMSVVTGVRTRVAPASDTNLNGEWQIQGGGGRATLITIDGLTASGKDPVINVAVAGGSASVVSSDKGFAFAARRR
jgi:hypothetical protein